MPSAAAATLRLCQPGSRQFAGSLRPQLDMQAPDDAFIFHIPPLQHMTEDDGERRWGAV